MSDATLKVVGPLSDTERVVSDAFDTASRARRYHRLEMVLVICTVAILLLGSGVALYLGNRQNEIRNVAHHQDCEATALANFAAATGDALGAPPAPNAARSDAVAGIQAAANELRRAVRAC